MPIKKKMPAKKKTKKKVISVPWGNKDVIHSFSALSKEREDQFYQAKLREKKQWLTNWKLQSLEQTAFVEQQGFISTFMNAEQVSYIFQWLLKIMGVDVNDWRVDIDVQVPVNYFSASLKALEAFHERMPEDIVVIDSETVSIATPGFDSLYAPNTPKNKVYSPSKIKKITRHILDMGDENRTTLSEQLRVEGIEIFRWGEDGAVPYRSEVKIPARKKRPRRVSW